MDHDDVKRTCRRAWCAAAASALVLFLWGCEQKPSAGVVERAGDRAAAEQASPRPELPPPVAADGKTEQAKSDAGAKPPSAGQPVSDRELTAKVKSTLLAQPLGALVFDVAVSGGVVTLHGTADTAATRDKAVKAASGVAGVKSVNNRIAILSGS